MNKSNVDKLLPGHILRDDQLVGLGVRRQKGRPVYFLQNGRACWLTIGTHGSPWTPDTARNEAHRLLAAIAAWVSRGVNAA